MAPRTPTGQTAAGQPASLTKATNMAWSYLSSITANVTTAECIDRVLKTA